MQVDAILGVAEKHHLLPFDLPECVVLDNDNHDRQLVLDRGYEVRHQHRKTTVPDERYTLASGMRDLRGNRVGKTGRHGGKISRQAEHLPAPGDDMPCEPGGNGSAVTANDR